MANAEHVLVIFDREYDGKGQSVFSAMPRSIAKLCVSIREGVGLMGLFVVKVFWSMNLLNSLFRAKSVGKNGLALSRIGTRRHIANIATKYLIAAMFLAFTGALTSAQAQTGPTWDWAVQVDDEVDGIAYDPSPAGTVVRVLVTVQNDSVNNAPATTLSFEVPQSTVPGSVSWVGTSSNGANLAISGCTPALPALGGTIVTCVVPSIPGKAGFDDDPLEAQIILDFQTSSAASLTLRVAVPDTPGDTNFGNNFEPEPITIDEGVDLDVDISTPATTLASGAVFNWTVDITNRGPNTATRYDVTVPRPTGVGNIVAPAGCSLSGSNYICTITTALGPNGAVAAPLVFSGRVDVGGPSDITLEAFVGNSAPLDPNSTNDQTDLELTVTPGTDAFIAKSRNPALTNILVGETVTFTLNTGFFGNAPTDIVVVDTLPSQYTFTGFVSTAGYTCNADDLPNLRCEQAATSSNGQPGAQGLGNIVFTARLDAPGQNIRNRSEISFGVTDGNPTGDVDTNPSNDVSFDTAITASQPVIDLVARKSGPSPALVVEGQNNTFRISARNAGNADFFGTVTLTDTIPAGMNVVGLNIPAGTSCTVGGVPATASVGSPIVGEAVVVCTRTYTAPTALPGSNSSNSNARNTPDREYPKLCV